MDDVILMQNALYKDEPRPTEAPFDYLFLRLANDPASHLPADNPAKVVADLKALGTAMIDDPRTPCWATRSFLPCSRIGASSSTMT